MVVKLMQDYLLFARIWFRAQDAETIEEFVKAIKVLPEVVECHLMAGENVMHLFAL